MIRRLPDHIALHLRRQFWSPSDAASLPLRTPVRQFSHPLDEKTLVAIFIHASLIATNSLNFPAFPQAS
jgi:hypothetical protein